MRSHVLCLVSRQALNNYRVWYRYSGTCSEIYSIWQVVFILTVEKSQHLSDFGSSQGWQIEGSSFTACDTVSSGEQCRIFWKIVVPSSSGSRFWPFRLCQHDSSQCQRTLTPHHSVTSLFITNPVQPDRRHTACSTRNLHTLEQKVLPVPLDQIILLKWPALTVISNTTTRCVTIRYVTGLHLCAQKQCH